MRRDILAPLGLAGHPKACRNPGAKASRPKTRLCLANRTKGYDQANDLWGLS